MRRIVKDKKQQHFIFDGKTKTVTSAQWTGKSLNIQSDGRSKDVFVQNTNARWW